MSKSGIQSNRGDGYQTLVAFEWALTVLSDPDYQWLEVDSVTWQVDDVVIGKADGTKICCQCKKNQTGHRAWSISDLADELHKASSLLASDPKTVVRFYSRSDFGVLAALREYSTNYADESAYSVNMGQAHGQTEASLKRLLVKQATSLSSYEFLRRTTFETSPELDRMETLLHERLRQLASNSSAAYNALWTRLDHLGMRVNGNNSQSAATQHRLTKVDLKALLAQAGAMLIPPMNMVEVRTSFQSTSAIGRTWRRDIGNQRISNPVINELIAAIEAKDRSILLTGLPGSGKTCVMLALQEKLEQLAQTRSDLQPLFIQSREFADMVTAQDRQDQGLPEQWVEKVARIAEDAHVVVVIDSLDVLSIAREHSVLTYFLAQIDRLLLIPNVTVITACRDFDRRYDHRIARRTWDKEFTCLQLDWDTEIAPLLVKLGIDASATDVATRELIRNPRELTLFVELAQQGGSFNVVTSQALAQRYLATIVQANSALGDAAMQAIEAIAAEMLKLRSLAVPHQRFTASQEIQRALLSHNVLHQTQDGQLTFGHQTLLDVLVISGAVRQGVTLNEFIQGLPPVPFVRPSIRSFVAQLATGDRRRFRKQLRTVLTGNNAFHIRRLVAECLAEQIPQDEDWLLIRDLRTTHRDVFQVIYTQAVRVEWHYFWFKHLVPVLRDARDVEGLTMHVNRVSQWKNDDAAGVLAFWAEVLALDGVDKTQFINSMAHAITQVDADHSALLAPLLVTLLKLPRQEHSFLGRALARCVKAGGVDDAVLWRYVAGQVKDEDVLDYRFNKKLHCQSHEFGNSNDKFLADRMQQSTALLDLAVATIERWSQIKSSRYGATPTSYWSGFLRETSYNDAHSQTDHRHLDSERILLDAIEAAIVHHAKTQSDWWKSNRERLCFSAEGSFRYFAILACMEAPTASLDVIGRMLCDKALLESDLSYELGTLMQTAFLGLDPAWQDAVQTTVLTLHQETTTNLTHRTWMLQKQAQLIVTIPCHRRSPAAQAVINECEKVTWPLVRQPAIGMRGGMVSAPFSFEVFLAASNDAVLRLLAHYNGYAKNSFDDFLIGGEREVGTQLREAASRHPTRFLKMLPAHWAQITDRFCDDIMDGVAAYLSHRYGNLQTNGTWSPIDEPNAATLAQQILDELERHPAHWHHNHAASQALQACSHVIQDTHDAGCLVFLAIGFSTLREESSISGDTVDLLTTGINMARGHVAEALMIVANQLQEVNTSWPELLAPTLRQFATDEHPAIRALLLRRLPYLQSHHPELGWALFDLAMQESAAGLWAMAEPCLYHAYHQQFEIITPWLARLYRAGNGKDLETWGRISALSALTKQLDLSALLGNLKTLDAAEAWRGAASVWTHPGNVQQHREQCLAGLEAGLNAENQHAPAVARKYRNLFRETKPLVSTPIELLRRCFSLLETEATESARSDIYGFDAWLNASSIRDPMCALEATEIYLDFVRRTKTYMYDHENNLTQLLTRLFAQAEEQEESDSGAMLQRVVVVQDALLTLGVNDVNDWLKVAERS
jgi:adenylylsulfate kinase-like enzyme